jgi:hypothetical protein
LAERMGFSHGSTPSIRPVHTRPTLTHTHTHTHTHTSTYTHTHIYIYEHVHTHITHTRGSWSTLLLEIVPRLQPSRRGGGGNEKGSRSSHQKEAAGRNSGAPPEQPTSFMLFRVIMTRITWIIKNNLLLMPHYKCSTDCPFPVCFAFVYNLPQSPLACPVLNSL